MNAIVCERPERSSYLFFPIIGDVIMIVVSFGVRWDLCFNRGTYDR